MDLDLTGLVVVAGVVGEIAAAIAALAGAKRVITIRRGSKRQSRIGETWQDVVPIADLVNLPEHIEIVSRMDPRAWRDVDILVTSPELGAISRSIVELLPSTAVVALMSEPWEVRPGLVDIDACDEAGIKIAAPNLSHPAIKQLPDLAQLCCRLVTSADLDPRGAKIAILCDTPCGPFIERALIKLGASVQAFPHPLLLVRDNWDAVVIALRPSEKPKMDINGLAAITESARGALLVQFSGEIDRVAARYFGLKLWPQRKPARGRLGLPLDALGEGPVFRRMVGGLKAAEAVLRDGEVGADAVGFVVSRGSMPV